MDDDDTALRARLRAAEAAAREAGAFVLERLGDVTGLQTKSTSKDLVTDIDIEAGRRAIGSLLASFPEDGVIVEEPAALEGAKPAPAGGPAFSWLIDPLDGTTSYVHSYPYFSVSIALLARGKPVAGVVFAPVDDECFSAAEGHGATLNGRAIFTSSVSSLDEALLITGFPYDRSWPLERQIRILYAMLGRVHGIRRGGSAALDLCYVAAGRADGYWELAMKDWDLAAGAVILREAGGKIHGFDGADWEPGAAEVVGTNGPLQDEVQAVIRNADPGAVPRALPSLL